MLSIERRSYLWSLGLLLVTVELVVVKGRGVLFFVPFLSSHDGDGFSVESVELEMKWLTLLGDNFPVNVRHVPGGQKWTPNIPELFNCDEI